MKMNIPNGHSQVIPYLMVKDGPGFIRFMQETFDAEVGTMMKSANGEKITHGEMTIGEGVVFFADGTEEDIDCGDECVGGIREPSNIHVYVYVDDAAEVVKKAEQAGGTPVMPIMEDGSGRMAGFLDPFQNLWCVKSPAAVTL